MDFVRCCLRKILEMLWNYKDIHFRLQTFAENQKSGSALAKPLRKPYIANKTKNRSSFEKRSFGLSDRIWTCGLYHPKVARYQSAPHPFAFNVVYYITEKLLCQYLFWKNEIIFLWNCKTSAFFPIFYEKMQENL